MFSATFLAGLLAVSGSAGEVQLLQFTADWCVACKSMKPAVQRLTAAGFPVREVNVDREVELVQQFRVTSVPCFVLVAGGREVERVAEATSYGRLAQMFERAGVPARGEPAGVASENQPLTPAGPNRALVRGQSGEPGGGLSLPRPLASLARSLGRRRAPDEKLVEIEPGSPASTISSSPPPASSFVSSSAPPPRPTSQDEPPSYPQPANSLAPNSLAPNSLAPNSLPASSPSSLSDPHTLALKATVRLRVDDLNGHGVGTGTIIDVYRDEALLITCGHLFRDSVGKGRIAVDLFVDEQPRTVNGTLIRYDLERDLGFVAIPAVTRLTPVSVAAAGFGLARGQSVFSVGCDRGADPTVRVSQITGIDRYVGAPNIEVAGQPVEGRSGGGLFAADGQLIGICNAADPADNEGVFASLPAIHWELDRIGQRRIYAPGDARFSPLTRQQAAVPAAHIPVTDPAPLTSIPPRPDLALQAVSPQTDSDDTEVICIVRSRANPQGTEQLLILDRPSRDLLDRLSSESRNRPFGGLAQQPSPSTNRPPLSNARFNPVPSSEPRPIIRAQQEER